MYIFMNNHYNKSLKKFAQELRSETVSKAERYIWKSLLSRKKMGFAFKRQRSIDNFIVDFFCAELKLIIEIDGNSHYRKPEYDYYRQEKLKGLGYTILRFTEGEVIQNIESVYERIVYSIECVK
ncbi:MAG: endonuclease domain-containing protein [Crocinitomicaceae bacterium]|nr:endonuclease domain-containing protein [Crocinitomicaceae bacterium]